MLKTVLFLAQKELPNPEADVLHGAPAGTHPILGLETSVVIGAALLIAAAVFFWAFFVRKRPKHQHGSLVLERVRKRGDHPSGAGEEHGASGRRKRRKRRPQHPDNWGRNPTLGETGGLPEAKPDEPDPTTTGDTPEPQR